MGQFTQREKNNLTLNNQIFNGYKNDKTYLKKDLSLGKLESPKTTEKIDRFNIYSDILEAQTIPKNKSHQR